MRTLWPKRAIRIGEEWAERVFTDLDWQPVPGRLINPGEAGGFIVEAEGFDFRGYLKPTKISSENHPRSASEKIAADLARHIDLSVPPALLYRRADCDTQEESCACISLVIYPEQWEWQYLQGLQSSHQIATDIVDSTLARNSGIIAFDTYTHNTDRNNGRNAIYGRAPGRLARGTFVFIDFANSMNHNGRWGGGAWRNVRIPGMFQPMERTADWDMICDVIGRIEGLDDKIIEDIVDRIPDDYMSQGHREIVREGLLGRRQLIRPVLAERFAEQAKGSRNV